MGTLKQLARNNKWPRGGSDQQTVSLRLEVLYETALINGDVPLDAH